MEKERKTVAELKQFVCRGSVLTVKDDKIAFYSMQGEARDFKENKIGLIFDERIHQVSYAVMGPAKHKCGEIVFFERSQLVLDDDWTFENKVKLAFPGNTHIASSRYKRAFQPGTPCECADCFEVSTERILVDIDGVIYEFDVCRGHGDKYRNSRPSQFPLRPQVFSNLNTIVVPTSRIYSLVQA